MDGMSLLPSDLYARIEASMPIACVDFVPKDSARIGLILRESPFGRVWCHLGGRILRGETIAAALHRHARETLAIDLRLPPDPQPAYVYQWFPPEIRPDDGMPHGEDPRKHAVGLSFIVEHEGEPSPRGEALEFGWFGADALPSPLWPGTATLLDRLGVAAAHPDHSS